MKKLIPLFFPFLLLADVKIGDVNFTDVEVNMSVLTLNHIDTYTLADFFESNSLASCVVDFRFKNNGILTVDDLKNVVDYCDLSDKQIFNLKQCSYKFSSDLIVNPAIGTTYPLTNFLYGLAGILVGFIILLGFIFAVK